MDVITVKTKARGYYIGHRQFELPELKLLVDAVQSSRFITEKKSKELIAKLSSLTSQAQAADLKRQVFVTGRPNSFNEQDDCFAVNQCRSGIKGLCNRSGLQNQRETAWS
ncbi:MAG: hypothetical protein FWC07_02355 [Defluviitaleaceae bacterium]|nr:hypothetical protein [Defluviitaleaceae bacterium]